jgi:hypothetical protein
MFVITSLHESPVTSHDPCMAREGNCPSSSISRFTAIRSARNVFVAGCSFRLCLTFRAMQVLRQRTPVRNPDGTPPFDGFPTAGVEVPLLKTQQLNPARARIWNARLRIFPPNLDDHSRCGENFGRVDPPCAHHGYPVTSHDSCTPRGLSSWNVTPPTVTLPFLSGVIVLAILSAARIFVIRDS